MKLIFQPAVRLLDRLNYPLKFGLIILVCMLASVILLMQIYTSLRDEIHVTEREIAGLKLFDAGFAVILNTQQHRGLSAGVLGGSRELAPQREQKAADLRAAIAALDGVIASEAGWSALQGGWQTQRVELLRLADSGLTLSGPDNFRAHTTTIEGLLRWLGELGDASGLALDPDAASANLIGPLLTTLPELSERLGQLRARGTGISARRELPQGDEHAVVALLAEIARAESVLVERLRRTAAANSALAARVESMGREISASVAEVRNATVRELLEQGFALGSGEFFALVTRSIDTAVRNFDQVLRPEVGRLLEERQQALSTRLGTQIAVSVVAMLLAGYLFIGIYLADRKSVV